MRCNGCSHAHASDSQRASSDESKACARQRCARETNYRISGYEHCDLGGKEQRASCCRRSDSESRNCGCGHLLPITGYRSDRVRICLLNCLHIAVADVVLAFAEDISEVVGFESEFLVNLVFFEAELVIRLEPRQLENQQVNP